MDPTRFIGRWLAYFFPGRKPRSTLEEDGVWVDDLEEIQFLWYNGFFGKGTLSRSEPSWRFSGLAPKKGRLRSFGRCMHNDEV
jgi:hypothetical protein